MKIVLQKVSNGVLLVSSSAAIILSAALVAVLPNESSASYRIPSNVAMYPSLPLAVGREVFQRVIANDTEWAYLVYLPPAYDSTSSKVWPLFIYMQPGGTYQDGWSGQNTSGLYDSARGGLNGGPAYYLNNAPSKFPSISTRFIVVTPFVSNNNASGGRLMGLFKYLKNRLKVDTTCTSMMGLCIGGQISYNFAAAYPRFLSSLVTMSTNGSGSPCNLALACNLKNIPYRVCADQRDPYVPTAATQALYDAVHNCGSTKATLTWTNVGMHEIWGYAGLDTAKEMYDWMLANAGSTTPVAPRMSDKQNAKVSMAGRSGLADIDLVGLNGQILSRYRGDPAGMNRMLPNMNRGVAVMRIHRGSQSIQRVIVSKP
jgi:dienelactone hydrolase